MSTRLIVSISSDIGTALARSWMQRGHSVTGTFRTESQTVSDLRSLGAQMVQCDLADPRSVDHAIQEIKEITPDWDVLVQAAGNQDPVGPFEVTEFDEWDTSVTVNFTSQLRITQGLLPTRNKNFEHGPLVLFFAGGGTNNATVNYSAYTISKIGLIKMCELLDAEVPDTRFSIIGPGWVDTKIHESTLNAPEMAGDNYDRTREKLASDELVPMASVVDCCDWVVGSPRDVVSGRNISLVFDDWSNPELDSALRADPNMYKLRRAGNDVLIRTVPVTDGESSQS